MQIIALTQPKVTSIVKSSSNLDYILLKLKMFF